MISLFEDFLLVGKFLMAFILSFYSQKPMMSSSLAIGPFLMAFPAICFNFDLDTKANRCFSEEIQRDQKVSGSYKTSEASGIFTDFRISDPNGSIISADTGKEQNSFYFAASTAGEYRFCFYNRLAQGAQYQRNAKKKINFTIKQGNEVKDYTNVATKYHLKPIQIELRVMEDTTKTVLSEHLYLRDREEELRVLIEAANGRTMTLSIVTLLLSMAFGYWQYSHLRKYFQSKRLID